PLRAALAIMGPGEVEELPAPVRDGGRHVQAVEHVVVTAGGGEHVACPQCATVHLLDLGAQFESCRLVRGFYHERVARVDGTGDEPGRPRRAVTAVAAQAGT